MDHYFVSIIIPCKNVNHQGIECIENCLKLDYSDFEIIILPDGNWENPYGKKVHVIPTGNVGPAEKRDLAARRSKGEILAFIDDDAYPVPSWLNHAIEHFQDDQIAAVGGPGITPPGDGLLEKASGKIYKTFMGSGSYSFRYVPKKKRYVDDFPSCNFIVRKSVFMELGGFDTKYWPGEDTKLALDITKIMGKRIIYDPDVLIYHHRRKLYYPHLVQAWRYGVQRGYFVKKFPETSRRISYFLPSFFTLGFIAGPFFFFINSFLANIYLAIISLYFILALGSSLDRDVRLIPLTFFGIFLTHVIYGTGFLKGLLFRGIER